METKPIKTSHLRNDEHFQFITEFLDLVKETTAPALKVETQFDNFLLLYGKEDKALKKILKSAITEDIHTADRRRDLTFSGMVEVNRSALKHFNHEKVAAAKRLQIVFNTYGNVANKPLNEQTSAVYNLLQELKSSHTADIATVGLGDWVQELTANNTAYETLVKDRYSETAQRTDLVLKEVRRQTDAAYRAVVERINAFALVEGGAVYNSFIRRMNTVIDKYSDTLAKRRGAAAAKKKADENTAAGEVMPKRTPTE
jgi:hypothetical protein